MADINKATNRETYLIPMIIVGVLFFALGFITWLNSTLINFLEIVCEIDNNVVLFFVTFSFYISYLVMSVPSSKLLERTGYKKGMALGLLGMAIGALIFIPAAQTRAYWLFLVGLFIQGGGMALLQTAVNPYVTILGPLNSAAKRISIMGICNKVAGAISPLILSAAILAGADAIVHRLENTSALAERETLLNGLSNQIIFPYIILAVILVGLFIWVWNSSLPELTQEDAEELEEVEVGSSHVAKHKTSIFQFPHAILGMIALFLYVGVEVIAGDTIGQYGRMLGFKVSQYQNFTTYTLGLMVVGYIIGIMTIPKYLSQQKALTLFSSLGVLFSILILVTSGATSILFVALLGFSNSILYPAIWPLTLNKLGHFTKIASGLLVMAISGGAVLPLLWGALANVAGDFPALPYTLIVPCYVFILYFGVKGYKVGLHLKPGEKV